MSIFWEPLGGGPGLQMGLLSWKQPFTLESFHRQSAQKRDLKGFYVHSASKSEEQYHAQDYIIYAKQTFGHLRHTLKISSFIALGEICNILYWYNISVI